MFGIFILANDAFIPWLEPFLVSLRTRNPAVPIVLIPYDDNCTEAVRVAKRHGCETLDMDLAPYDKIGFAFHPNDPTAAHIYRKLAIFDGPLSTFLYLDIDLIVATDLRYIQSALSRNDYDICFYRTAMPGRNFTDHRQVELKTRHSALGTLGFNAAFIASSRGALNLAKISAIAREQKTLARLLGPAREQALLNYCVAAYGLRTVTLPSLMPELSYCWDSFLDIRWDADAKCYRTGPDCPRWEGLDEILYGREGPVAGKIVPMIHWGGHGRPLPRMHNFAVWNRFARWPDASRVADGFGRGSQKPLSTINSGSDVLAIQPVVAMAE